MRHLVAQPLKVGTQVSGSEPGRAALLGPAIVSWPSSPALSVSFCRSLSLLFRVYWLCFLGGGT